MRLLVWGLTEADQKRAVYRTGQGRSRNGSGYGWAYLVYPADDA